MKKTVLILVWIFAIVLPLLSISCISRLEQSDINVEETAKPSVTNTVGVPTKEIYDANNMAQGYIEIYVDHIKYINERLGYSFELPKTWEDNFIVNVDYDTKLMSVRFFGESEEGRGISPNGKYYGLCIFEIIHETNFEGLMYERVCYLGTVDGEKLYHIESPDCEICGLADEIEWYEYGESKYQDDEEQIELMRRDLEKVKTMVTDYNYEELNFRPLE